MAKAFDIIIKQGTNDVSYHKQKALQIEWDELCNREEEYWHQKSRELWLREGAKNTSFFYFFLKQKRAVNCVLSINNVDIGIEISNMIGIQEEGVRFFKSLLAPPTIPSSGGLSEQELLNDIPSIVIDALFPQIKP